VRSISNTPTNLFFYESCHRYFWSQWFSWPLSYPPFHPQGPEVVAIARSRKGWSGDGMFLEWDGKDSGPWELALEGAEAVINLAGRSVNCRYTEENRRQIMDSRVDSTRAIGEARSSLQDAAENLAQRGHGDVVSPCGGQAAGRLAGRAGRRIFLRCRQGLGGGVFQRRSRRRPARWR
jgi:hypothetical protein